MHENIGKASFPASRIDPPRTARIRMRTGNENHWVGEPPRKLYSTPRSPRAATAIGSAEVSPSHDSTAQVE